MRQGSVPTGSPPQGLLGTSTTGRGAGSRGALCWVLGWVYLKWAQDWGPSLFSAAPWGAAGPAARGLGSTPWERGTARQPHVPGAQTQACGRERSRRGRRGPPDVDAGSGPDGADTCPGTWLLGGGAGVGPHHVAVQCSLSCSVQPRPQPLALSCLHCGLDQPCPGAGAEGLLCLPRGAAAGSSPDPGTCPMSPVAGPEPGCRLGTSEAQPAWGCSGVRRGPGGRGEGTGGSVLCLPPRHASWGLLGGGIWVRSRGDMVAAGSGPRRTPWAETGLHPGVGLPCSRRLQCGWGWRP